MEPIITINGVEKTADEWVAEYRRLGGLAFRAAYGIGGMANLRAEIEKQEAKT